MFRNIQGCAVRVAVPCHLLLYLTGGNFNSCARTRAHTHTHLAFHFKYGSEDEVSTASSHSVCTEERAHKPRKDRKPDMHS